MLYILPTSCTIARTRPKVEVNGYMCCVAMCYYAIHNNIMGYPKGLLCSIVHLIVDM